MNKKEAKELLKEASAAATALEGIPVRHVSRVWDLPVAATPMNRDDLIDLTQTLLGEIVSHVRKPDGTVNPFLYRSALEGIRLADQLMKSRELSKEVELDDRTDELKELQEEYKKLLKKATQ